MQDRRTVTEMYHMCQRQRDWDSTGRLVFGVAVAMQGPGRKGSHRRGEWAVQVPRRDGGDGWVMD